MTALKWLTPDDPPDGTKCIALWLPDGEEYEAAARGALSPLMFADNWEQIGSETPEDTSQAFRDAFSATFAWKPCSEVEFMQYIHVVDQKAQGVNAGGYDSEDTAVTRDLNTLLHDGTGDAFLDDNCLGIPAGRYTVLVTVPYVKLGPVAVRLYVFPQVSGFSPFVLDGENDRAVQTGGSGHSHVRGYLEVDYAAYLRVYMRGGSSQEDYGLGIANSFWPQERYTSIELWKWLTGEP